MHARLHGPHGQRRDHVIRLNALQHEARHAHRRHLRKAVLAYVVVRRVALCNAVQKQQMTRLDTSEGVAWQHPEATCSEQDRR